jgi:type II secretory pathway component GspD/PulD (secretin)
MENHLQSLYGECGVKETPLLSKLPMVGNLFRHVKKDRQKIELVILLTPFINYSRSNSEITSDQNQLPRYKEVAKNYRISEGEFKNH